MPDLSITIKKDGPYLLSAEGVALVDHEGRPVPIPEGKKNIALCRCGGSQNKPFCDGTHSRIGFRGAEEAVRAAEQGKA